MFRYVARQVGLKPSSKSDVRIEVTITYHACADDNLELVMSLFALAKWRSGTAGPV